MPIDPSALKALVDAGGWTVVLVGIVGVTIGLVRRLWVPGWLWLQERRDRLASDAQAAANARALARLARQYQSLAKSVASIDAQLVTIAAQIRSLHDRDRRG